MQKTKFLEEFFDLYGILSTILSNNKVRVEGLKKPFKKAWKGAH